MSKIGLNRLRKQYDSIQKDPPPNAIACPDPQNWFHWHFAIYGLEAPYQNGVYHGELRFPYDYPMGPPSIIMHTPSGRFQTEMRICTTMSDYHRESWSPIWKVSTIITGFVSFMQSDENSTGTVQTSDAQKRVFAQKSQAFNARNSKFVEIFEPYFPDIRRSNTEAEQPINREPKHLNKIVGMIVLIAICYVVAFKQ